MAEDRPRREERTFLVVIDQSEEMKIALRFAALRAKATNGRVALFTTIEPTDFGHWQSVAELHEEETRDAAEAMMKRFSDQVEHISGKKPIVYIRKGKPRDALLELLAEDPNISVLVLAAGTSGKDPGPLITALTGKYYARVKIPITIVPGGLSDEELAAIT